MAGRIAVTRRDLPPLCIGKDGNPPEPSRYGPHPYCPATSSVDDDRGSAAAVIGGERLALRVQTIPNLIGYSSILIGFGAKIRGVIIDAGTPVTYRVSNLPVFTGASSVFQGEPPILGRCYAISRRGCNFL